MRQVREIVRLSVFALVRSLPRLGTQALGHDAPVPRRRGEAVCRLCGRPGGGVRPADRRGEARLDLRRGDGRINNELPLRRLGVTRRHLLEELDRPALKPLPLEPYVYAECRIRRVGIDYHIDVERHYYSVPVNRHRSGTPLKPNATH